MQQFEVTDPKEARKYRIRQFRNEPGKFDLNGTLVTARVQSVMQIGESNWLVTIVPKR